VRAALACCPRLVTNLLAPTRPDPVRYLGLARTVMAGSEPVNGEDPVSRLLDSMEPEERVIRRSGGDQKQSPA
jgi:hypothetical protein